MSHEYLQKRRIVAVVADFGAVAEILQFTPQTPIDVYRFGIMTSAGLTSGTGITIDLATETPFGGSPVSVTSFTHTTNEVAGAQIYKDVIIPVAQAAGEDALEPSYPQFPRSVTDVAPAGPLLVNVGQSVLVRVTAEQSGTTAGAGVCFIEYVEHDFQPGFRENVATVNDQT